MSPISKLTDDELHHKIKNIAGEEKAKTLELIAHLEVAELRKLYLKKGYPNLFEYCVQELNYSRGATHRRISSMRLIQTLPEAKEKLTEGTVTLTTLCQLQGFIKKEKKVLREDKLDLLNQIENKSERECEREFVKISPTYVQAKDRARAVTEELKRDLGRCQYVDKDTNKKCQSQFALEIDHIHPYSLGGSNDESNLRLLCRNHNQWRSRSNQERRPSH